MPKKLFNTYSVGDELTLYELDRLTLKGIDYVLLLQKQLPNIVCVGFFEDGNLRLVKNSTISKELLKIFMKDEKAYRQKLEPFIIKDKKWESFSY